MTAARGLPLGMVGFLIEFLNILEVPMVSGKLRKGPGGSNRPQIIPRSFGKHAKAPKGPGISLERFQKLPG